MQPLTFDQYKLLKDNGNSFELAHPDGSNFTVAKKGLEPDFLAKIGSLGAPADPMQNATPTNNPIAPQVEQPKGVMGKLWDAANTPIGKALGPDPMQTITDVATAPIGKVLTGNVEFTPQTTPAKPKQLLADGGDGMLVSDGQKVPLEQTIGAPQNLNASPAVPAVDPAMSEMNKAFALQQKGINDAAKAAEVRAAEEVAAYAAQEKALQESAADYKTRQAGFDAENEQLKNDYMNEKVDPRKFVNSLSTGNKVLAGIAMTLGGLGAGLAGGENQGLAMINKFINDDIDAQKKNLDKKGNLLSINLQRTRDLQTAEALTRSQQLAITAAQVEKAKSKASSPEARARADVMLGQIKMQQQQLNSQVAKTQMLNNVGKPGVKVNPEALPEDQRKRLITAPNGQQYLSQTDKGAEDLREELSTLDPIFKELDALDKLGSAAYNPRVAEEAELRVANLVNLLKTNQGLTKPGFALGKEDFVSVLNQFDDPRKFKEFIVGGGKSKALKGFLMNKINAKLKNNVSNFQEPFSPKSAAPGYVSR